MSHAFPEQGRQKDEVLGALIDARARDLKIDGSAFAFVYDAGDEARVVAREAFASCMGINGLDPTAYPSARTIENAVVGACLELMRAPTGAVGTATAGGTESVMLAVKAARDFARKTRPEIAEPVMLLPLTAHACFHKAAHYLGVRVVVVEVDPLTMRASVEDARRKMSKEVILVVGSAPSYAHGVVDPIEELAALAGEHGALMHVDACVGGCVLPFMRDNGESVPAFDFQVDGVTSISLDLHKYGFAPKGISMLLVRRRELRDAHYFACAKWPGYGIVNSTTLGSKSCAATAAALALMGHLGKQGYRERVKKMWAATCELVRAIDQMPGIHLVARPDINLFAFTTERGDVFELADRLGERGWLVQPTGHFGPSPAHIHLTIDPSNADRVDALAADIRECLVDLPDRIEPPAGVVSMLTQVSGGAGGIDTSLLLAELGITDGRLPTKAAMIHRLLDSAPAEAREALLTMFMSELFS